MRFISSIFYILVACSTSFLLTSGCTSLRNEVDPSILGSTAPKLVVTCFLSPQDSVLAAKITRSNTVVGDSLTMQQTGNNITDATVTLSDGSRSVSLVYKAEYGFLSGLNYSISARLFPIVAGHTYVLTVVTPNGQRATSTCTIPQAVVPTHITFDSSTVNQRLKPVMRYYAITSWQDPAGQPNAYQVAGIFRYKRRVNCDNCAVDSYNTLSFDNDSRGLLIDTGIDGTEMKSGNAYLSSSSSDNFYNQYSTASITINLISVSQAYYRYQEAVLRQRRSRNNPFAEPVLIPSNIEGGLGCFAGYNNVTLTKTLK